jgi:hypothetical protein
VTWFKLDDGFYDHPKVADLPDSAVALWARSASYCMKHLTDGAVPLRTARRLVDDFDEAVKALLDSGLWEEDSGGYVFHDWLKYQPSREKVLGERESEAERQRQIRANKKPVRADVRPYERRTNTRTSDVSTPVRTDTPTRPDPSPPLEASSSSKSGGVDLSALPNGKNLDEMPEEDKPAAMRSPLTTVRCPEHQDRKIGDCHWCKTEHGSARWFADPDHWGHYADSPVSGPDYPRVQAWAAAHR